MSESEPIDDGGSTHSDDHESGDGHDDDHGAGHGHETAALGPIDLAAWGAGLLGLAIGGVMGLVFALSTGLLAL